GSAPSTGRGGGGRTALREGRSALAAPGATIGQRDAVVGHAAAECCKSRPAIAGGGRCGRAGAGLLGAGVLRAAAASREREDGAHDRRARAAGGRQPPRRAGAPGSHALEDTGATTGPTTRGAHAAVDRGRGRREVPALGRARVALDRDWRREVKKAVAMAYAP